MPIALKHLNEKIALAIPNAATIQAIETALTKKKVSVPSAKAASENIANYISHYMSAASPYFDRQTENKKAIKRLKRFVTRSKNLKQALAELDPSDRLQVEILADGARWLKPRKPVTAGQKLPHFARRRSDTAASFVELVIAYAAAGRQALKEVNSKKSKNDGARARRLLGMVAVCWRNETGKWPAYTDDVTLGMPKFVKLIRDAADSIPSADANKVAAISGHQLELALKQVTKALADEPDDLDE